MKKLLLHLCCAPCSASVIKYLKEEFDFLCESGSDKQKLSASFYWYNPNIWDFDEYNKRKESAVRYAKELKLDFYEEKDFSYNYDDWKKQSGEICANCYKLRLEKAAKFAKENGFDCFSTSLLSSPYQKHDIIKQVSQQLSGIYEIEFLYRNFTKFFYDGKNELRKQGYYLQKYCACNKSYNERFANKL
ncbi:MAG: epoxyqueuosine reductase QueH [Endomicrobium sp.]|nr:epoxyqueuosine reductase QueH [Endomicrobium sp.]